MTEISKVVASRLAEHGLTPTPDQIAKLARYLGVLERWNSRMNLTALHPTEQAVDRLIVEPVVAASVISNADSHLVDLGSGGGSPAVPMKVMHPGLRLMMVEVRTRKSVFLREAIRELGLDRASVVTGTFEEALTAGRVGHPDLISARAIRLEHDHIRLIAQALAPGGRLLWFLGPAQEPVLGDADLEVEEQLTLVPSLGSRLVVLRRR